MMYSILKKLFLIIFICYVECILAPGLIKLNIVLRLTFLAYSFYMYRSKNNIGSIEAFCTGLFIDLISNTFFGHNAVLFCFASYLINTYANAFKLFSYLQVCIFFGVSASAYVGFTQIIINLYNFSYLTLFVSTLFNILLCISIAILSVYFPSFTNRKI